MPKRHWLVLVALMSVACSGSSAPKRSPNDCAAPHGERPAGRIAFTSGITGTSVCVLDDGATAARRISPSGVTAYGPVWSPDGETIAYTAAAASGAEVHMVAPDGSDDRVAVSGGGDNIVSAWTRDGSGLLVTRIDTTTKTADIVAIDVRTRAERLLTPPARTGWSDAADVSPDGSRLIFRTITPPMLARGDAGIATMRIDGSRMRLLLDPRDDVYAPRWSPDGRLAAYCVCTAQRAELAVMAPDGSSRRVIARGAGMPSSWSPDGSAILYGGELDRTPGLWLARADGSGVRLLIPNAGTADWSP